MVLNTFHLAGVASKSNVTGGLPRLKELLKVTQNPKGVSLSISLRKEYRESKEKAREVAQQLELTMLRDITTRCAIYYDPKSDDTVLEEDRALLKFYALYEQEEMAGAGSAEPWSPWMLRLEFDREKMFDRNISMYDVAFVLRDKFNNCNFVYSDYNAQKLVMRIRVPAAGMDGIAELKKYQNKLLNGVILRGAIGLKSVSFRKDETQYEERDGRYEKITQYMLDTDGSNFLEVMNHPAINGNRVYSTNVHDLYEQYGIEAARIGLLKELTIVFEEAGVNIRHLGLLVDMMTRSGRLMSMDRYGINKRDIGPLAKASFEETGKILLKASLFGEVDPITGVSANIMTGQPIRGGTAFSQILLDEAAVVNMYKGLGPAAQLEDEDETDFTALEQELGTSDDVNDACALAKFQMSVVLPPPSTVQEEEDIELNVIA
jgi:DNA-directed RNA polymerase II subunit RPB1